MIQKRLHHHSEQQQYISKKDSHKQGQVTGFVLQDNAQAKTAEKFKIRQTHCFFPAGSAKIMTQEF